MFDKPSLMTRIAVGKIVGFIVGLIGFLLLQIYPFCASLIWSFSRYDLLSPPEYVGTLNYQRIGQEFLTGEGFGRAVWNTAYYGLVSVPLR